jgi:transposase
MGVPTMGQVRTWAALEVHATKVVAAAVDSDSGELQIKRLPGQTRRVVEFCTTLPAPVRVAYEAGPTGFGLARELETAESSAWWQRPARSSALRRIG